MYANLKVQPLPNAEVWPEADAKRELRKMQEDNDGVIYAHEVVVQADGRMRVALDKNSEGNYAEHGGYVLILGGARIEADF